jgi:hypothetical protein
VTTRRLIQSVVPGFVVGIFLAAPLHVLNISWHVGTNVAHAIDEPFGGVDLVPWVALGLGWASAYLVWFRGPDNG